MNPRRSQSDWQRLIDEQKVSGLSQKAFCAQTGIAVATYQYWKRKLRVDAAVQSDAVTGSRKDWLELTPELSEPALGWHIELDLGHGVCLRLRQG
ncbi:IS66 family insertion sequence element accessory protein TnpB [Acidithiobacillus sp. CV18-2]|uniref:IS66 family insertion sequence element accessory protein TnpB n=1 Tax=Igneacidithiobacillus copahuensis TaxID=2724909 RepID=A0AAE3CIC4_9PROT|nr:IS66 family insertion sequence element accessory protein TnpB [Igneacidithiobacillus copahuensis]MBU2755107.1 IS66 family insertion sequence element accessory protein TnpB [Acidithiobacillus sp. CV18-3]MBU2755912.1 IS66 family insertion sequence element accessory protein TnpB [Acidithiobacillus sp. BN09-2]MBU2777678.1 IS66 family insertion sequence element accessory protein TnpB [Acidithiobacillus sp. CV18-2]MBU2795541.1 IS66 family insertion sequence element accessory protein TnpB [Acidithi